MPLASLNLLAVLLVLSSSPKGTSCGASVRLARAAALHFVGASTAH